LSNIANEAFLKAVENLKELRKDKVHDKLFVITDLVKLGSDPLVVGRPWPLCMPESAILLFNKQPKGIGNGGETDT
jgi:hypothetical protein